jgi:hypothetical protein
MNATAQITGLDHRQLAQVTATRCCVCNARLTDAESVEHGIGPTCSRRYYNPKFLPTKDDLKNALGLLAVSKLPDHIIDGFLSLVGNNHANARKACNILIYWSSAHYDDRDEVFKCCTIIRALGYVELADKLETDRTVVTLLDKGKYFEAYTPTKHPIPRDIERIPGVEPLIDPDDQFKRQLKRGHKVGWKVPKAQGNYLMTVLGYYLGGKLSCGTAGIRTISPKRYGELLAFRRPTMPTAPTTGDNYKGYPVHYARGDAVIVQLPTGKLGVYTPYHPQFIEGLKKAVPYRWRGWNPQYRRWEVDATRWPKLQPVILQFF